MRAVVEKSSFIPVMQCWQSYEEMLAAMQTRIIFLDMNISMCT
jgi:hypothetical protein